MRNITLAIDDDVLRKVRKLAIDQDTTLNALVRDYLTQLANRGDLAAEEIIAQLKKSFDSAAIRVGSRSWTRDDLHAR